MMMATAQRRAMAQRDTTTTTDGGGTTGYEVDNYGEGATTTMMATMAMAQRDETIKSR